MDAPALLMLISHPTKHGILARLREGEAAVGELVEATGAAQSNVSHQLASLREAGLVRVRAAGRTRRYRLADPELRRLLDQVDALADRLERVAYYSGLELPFEPGFHGYG